MLTIKAFQVNPLGVNCYVVNDDTKDAVIIDCGCFTESEWKKIKRYIDENELNVVHLLNTHFHFDHMMGIPLAVQDFPLKPEGNYADEYLYNSLESQTESFMGVHLGFPPVPQLGKNLSEGTIITFGSHTLQVIQTPGHTPGSVCLYCEEEAVLFSGDTLFQCSIGRTDFPGGNYHEMMTSLLRLKELPRDTQVYPGHGGMTNMGYECDYNPYF